MPTPYLAAVKVPFTEPVNIQTSQNETTTTITWNEPVSAPGDVKLWCLHLAWTTGKASTHVRTSEQTSTGVPKQHHLTLEDTRQLETIVVAPFTAGEYGPAATYQVPAITTPTDTLVAA